MRIGERTVERSVRSGCPAILRVGLLRVPEDRPSVHGELRHLPEWGKSRWIGRRMMDDPPGPELAVVSSWDSLPAMEAGVAAGRERLGPDLREALGSMSAEVYACRASGAWRRPDPPVLLRIFRGKLVEGNPDDFDEAAVDRYIAGFAATPSCVAILAGIDAEEVVALVTLWTSWGAIVTATGGDVGRVLPVNLPGWSIEGSAVHYEVVVAETAWSGHAVLRTGPISSP